MHRAMLRLVRHVTQPVMVGLPMATAYQAEAPMVLETHCRFVSWNVRQMVVRVIVERPMRSVPTSLTLTQQMVYQALASSSVSLLLK